jgi:hypothetical protein
VELKVKNIPLPKGSDYYFRAFGSFLFYERLRKSKMKEKGRSEPPS